MFKLDGTEIEIEIGNARAGWVDVFHLGHDLTARKCRVARYAVPESLLINGGAVSTGGHKYEFKKTP